MNQVSDQIANLGIGERVDYNLCYKNYTEPKYLVELPPEKEFETKDYNRKEPSRKKLYVGITTGLITLFVINKKRKKIKRYIKRVINNKNKQKVL